MNTDFDRITPCGGDCTTCVHFINGECIGCLRNGGECVHMWENGCDIFRCCKKHGVKFCGLCKDFPCEWIAGTISRWDKDGIKKLKLLAEEYQEEMLLNK